MDAANNDYKRWSEYNEELLRRMFSSAEYATSYSSVYGGSMVVVWGGRQFHEDVQEFRESVDAKINNIRSLAERLDLIAEAPSAVDADAVPQTRRVVHSGGKKVFVVHGRDEEAKQVVARFLERCDLEPVILHEQADQGRTIIEKFEDESDVGFAVILLTPDDVGGLAAADGQPVGGSLQFRARQNVVLELGYFIGRLGRSRVCALKRGDLDLPSDISGVIYTPYTADEAWKMKLARELKAAGYNVDLNSALG
ncbi:nucleotide-binding protein [Sphingomonas sp.]|uniref:nucleotide-binding protein n=1 Tax=Sphingomonas sp. TaxID=28214 RepID=UPI0025E8F7A4|nr:nucleotide-binding protein [Sphingomonas sp.]